MTNRLGRKGREEQVLCRDALRFRSDKICLENRAYVGNTSGVRSGPFCTVMRQNDCLKALLFFSYKILLFSFMLPNTFYPCRPR